MKHLRRVALGALGVVATSGAAWAEDLALVLANRAYDNAPYVRESATAIEMSSALKQAGFRVFEAREQTAAGLQAMAGQFQAALEAQGDDDRIMIVLSGHLARTTRDVFLLGRDAKTPSALSIGAEGLPVSALLDMAETAPGQAVVMIATVDYDMETGAGVTPRMGGLRAPQGVTLVTGDIAQMVPLLRDGFLQPGKSLKAAAAMAGEGVEVSGFVSPAVRLVPGRGLDVTSGVDGGDQAYWDIVADIGTVESLMAYIARYPQGRFTGEAQRRIEQIRSEPERRAQAEEVALNLSREDRRQIQYFLELLGYDPRGVDGIFGRGSRAAIAAWQRGAGQSETGYLNRGQLNALQAAGARRAAELENEARRRREQQEREDQVFWNSTGRGGDEAGLRAYLQRYPDGIYAGVAQERLELIEAQLRAQTQRAERDAWDQARAADDIAGYTAFLQSYPQSGFAESAGARLEELRDEERNRDQIERDRAEEKVIADSLAARQLIERRLEQLGLEPGPVDGEFTRETRRAIRRFQRAQDLPATAYISRATVVRLMTPTK